MFHQPSGPTYLPVQTMEQYNTYYQERPVSTSYSTKKESWIGPQPQLANCEARHENRLVAWIQAIFPLAVHLGLVIGILVFMLAFVDGGEFNIHERKPFVTMIDGTHARWNHYRPLQSDITTFISALMAILKVFTGMWCGATGWRCAFILMEKRGLTLKGLKRVVGRGMTGVFGTGPKKGGSGSTVALIAILLFLSVPAQFAAPVLTGSITWASSYQYVLSPEPVSGITQSANSDNWQGYNGFAARRSITVLQAAGLANVAWATSAFSTSIGTEQKRVLLGAENLPLNSSLESVTVPYFSVSAIEWVSDLSTLTDYQRNVVDTDAGILNISSAINPLEIIAPNLALIPNQEWSQPPENPDGTYQLPDPSTVSTEGMMVIMVSRQPNNQSCSWQSTSWFGEIPQQIALYPIAWPAVSLTNCYAFGKINFTAGVADCEACKITSRSVLSSDPKVELSVQADPMTQQALYMMPEVISSMAQMNATIPLQYNNLEGYIQFMLTQSYGQSWAALTNYIGQEAATLQTNAIMSIPSSQAQVLRWRAFLWFGLNILLTISGMLFIIVQMSCQKPMVVDPGIAAMMFDTSDVHDKRRGMGLCNLSMLSRKESKKIGPLRLRKEGDHMAVVVMADEDFDGQ